jgi:hypothetical protein
MSERTQAALDVLDERARQINAEGWTLEHDDAHNDGDLAGAAAAYALNAACLLCPYNALPLDALPDSWPADWSPDWWKPATRPNDARRDLVKSAALILAEIERLDRVSLQSKSEAV